MDDVTPSSHHYVSQRLRLNFVDWGNPEKPPLLLVHGGRDHCRNWDWTARLLRDDWHIIAPDLRGHGDSEWVNDGNYLSSDMAYDLAQLVEHLDLAPVTIVGHSLGGNVGIRFAAAFPEQVRKLAVIEGLGPSPKVQAEKLQTPYPERVRAWMEKRRAVAGKSLRHYATLADAEARMRAANGHLSDEQIHHLTLHGVRRLEDGSLTWKFDPGLTIFPAEETSREDMHVAWAAITCPTLLLYGTDSWASSPIEDGRLAHFTNAECIMVDGAGHWLHHDQHATFVRILREFL